MYKEEIDEEIDVGNHLGFSAALGTRFLVGKYRFILKTDYKAISKKFAEYEINLNRNIIRVSVGMNINK